MITGWLRIVFNVAWFLLGFAFGSVPSNVKLEFCKKQHNVYECELVAQPKSKEIL